MEIRPATLKDDDALWSLLEPVIRAGETYTLPQDWSQQETLAYWHGPGHQVFVAEGTGDEVGQILGTYYLQANQKGGGAHVANCGYVTAPWAGGRGVARALCVHSLDLAPRLGFRAMQFNFVVATNTRAVALWQSLGFMIVGRLPGAFAHPRLGDVDGLIMYRKF